MDSKIVLLILVSSERMVICNDFSYHHQTMFFVVIFQFLESFVKCNSSIVCTIIQYLVPVVVETCDLACIGLLIL